MEGKIDAKALLRGQSLAARDALPPAERERKSGDIAGHGDAALSFTAGSVVSGFWPIRSEADPRPLLELLRRKGARVCLPVIVDRETILFRDFSQGAPLVAAGFGTFGSGAEAAVVDPDIMLVPLAAFDASGHRVGYGAGYYDRAIARLRARGRDPLLIGVAFDCQAVAAVPAASHDVPLDAVLTESGFRHFGGGVTK